MGIRFSKSIKIGKYLKINISKSGISATVGKKGASINIGGKGTYVNVSPTAVGLSGTGLSYRQKITGGYKQLLGKIFAGDKEEASTGKKEETVVTDADLTAVEEYEKNFVANVFPYRFIDNVLTKKEFDAKISNAKSSAAKMVYQLTIDGDEDTIESMVGTFLNSLELDYDVKASYELEDKTLFVDLDLPEIEDLAPEYPTESKGKVVMKKKSQAVLKEEYSNTVMGLAIYLAANFFNISSYVDKIVMSGFTTRRNSKGDLHDDYLYSVKFTRDIFEKSDLSKVEDAYEFLNKFENRMNLSGGVFKAVEPYEMESAPEAASVSTGNNPLLQDAVNGLKELGYNAEEVDGLIPELSKLEFATSGEYLKAALKLMSE